MDKNSCVRYLIYSLTIILCFGTLFFKSYAFIDIATSIKWYCFIIIGPILILVYNICSIINLKINITISYLYFIILILCSYEALYGIIQYINSFSSFNSQFIVGSFDNPTGFAASLCSGFPVSFYYMYQKKTYIRYLSIIAAFIISIAVILSNSRSGIICLYVLIIIHSFQYFHNKKKIIISISILSIFLCTSLYYLKKDSADGRMLIWKCSLDIFKDYPLRGSGNHGFSANYMNYQAKYFEQEHNNKYLLLADNINRPYNEYLLLIVNYGCLGLCLVLILIYALWKMYIHNKDNIYVQISGYSLFGIMTFSMFSYPLEYPFVWVIIILNIIIIIHYFNNSFELFTNKALKLILILPLSFIIFHNFSKMEAEIQWNQITQIPFKDQKEKIYEIYNKLYTKLYDNKYFLYNYAAVLYKQKRIKKSLSIAHECEQIWADYDLQLLIADNYKMDMQYEKAEHYYIKASYMCPSRFIPLYRLFQIYNLSGNKTKAIRIANKIINKPVKIMSHTIKQIKADVKLNLIAYEKKKIKHNQKIIKRNYLQLKSNYHENYYSIPNHQSNMCNSNIVNYRKLYSEL